VEFREVSHGGYALRAHPEKDDGGLHVRPCDEVGEGLVYVGDAEG